MSFKANSLAKLNSGYTIPRIGFGVLRIEPSETVDSVIVALETGYRHVDCAKFYKNERDSAEGILRYTTKIWNEDHGYKKTTVAIDAALEKLSGYSKEDQPSRNLGYIDLVLIHSPMTNRERRLGSWKALQEAVNLLLTSLSYILGFSDPSWLGI